MAAEEPFDAGRPHDEVWWAGELHRSEKLMDKFMAALGDLPDWDKLTESFTSFDLVHPSPTPPSSEAEEKPNVLPDAEEDAAFEDEMNERMESDDSSDDDDDEDPEVNGDYPGVAKLARDFAVRVFDLENPPGNAELLYLAAGKVGANLAGGHGLGYDDEFICGNIVKCRWALSDCEFCREMLEQLHEQTGEEVYARLVEDSRRIADILRDRIARLRRRVWW